MKPTKEDLIKYLENENKLWVPISDIIQQFPGEEKEIISVLNNNEEFVKTTRTTSGEELFASKNQVRAEGNFVDKLIGAFKNRID